MVCLRFLRLWINVNFVSLSFFLEKIKIFFAEIVDNKIIKMIDQPMNTVRN